MMGSLIGILCGCVMVAGWVFVCTAISGLVIQKCISATWWGAPVWMAYAVGILAPLGIGGIFACIRISITIAEAIG